MPSFNRLFLLGAILFCCSNLNAQPGGGDPGGGEKPVPISGIEILLAAGGLLGLKKFLVKRNVNRNK
jgi:hypothetical protein